MPSPSGPRITFPGILLVAGLLALVVESVVFITFGTTVYDEGGYLYEGWLTVSQGHLPFRDFHAKLPPLLYYLYGIGQHLFGPSVLVGRIESALFMFGGLALALKLARRMGGPWAGVLLVWLVAANPFFLNHSLHAYAVAPTAFFVVLALALLSLPRFGVGALLGSGAAIGAMLLCRHDLLPLALVLWVFILWKAPAPLTMRVWAVLVSWLVFALAILPFYLQAPDNVLQSLTLGKLGPRLPSVAGFAEAAPVNPRTLAWYTMIAIRYYAGALILLGAALAVFCCSQNRLGRSCALSASALALAAAGVQWFSHVPAALATGGNVFYLLDPYIFWAVALGAVGLFTMLPHIAGAPAPSWSRLVGAVGVLAILMPVFTGPGPFFNVSLSRPTELSRIRSGTEALKRHIPPDATIFTVDDPHHFLEAGLVLPHSLTHQLFSFREAGDTERLRSAHFYNEEMIREWLSGDAQYAVISASTERFMLHSGRYPHAERLHRLITKLIEKNYRLVAVVPEAYGGPLRIYRLKSLSAYAQPEAMP